MLIKFFPNFLSLLRAALAPLFIYLFLYHPEQHILILIVLTIAVATDYFDGYSARSLNVTSRSGGFLDPLADKIFLLSAYGVFAYVGFIPFWTVAALAVRDVLITGLRIHFMSRGTIMTTTWLGKVKTAAQIGALYAMLGIIYYMSHHNYLLPYVMYAVVFLTWFSGIMYLVKNIPLHAAIFLASCSYIGFMPVAPGTTMSLVTVALFFSLPQLSICFHLIGITFVALIGLGVSWYIEKTSGEHDPSWIVVDEVVGMWIALVALPQTFIYYTAAFAIFRFFDVSKWCGVSFFERLPNGFGVMLDDVAAGVYTCLLIHTIKYLFSLI